MSVRCASTRFRMRNMMSVRFESDVARQAGKAALAAATAASTSSPDAKSTCLRHGAGGRIEDGSLASGRARDDRTTDAMADPARGRRVGELAAGFCDLRHGVGPRRVWLPKILPWTVRTAGGTPGPATRGPALAWASRTAAGTIAASARPARPERRRPGRHRARRDPGADQSERRARRSRPTRSDGEQPAGNPRRRSGRATWSTHGPRDGPQPDPEEESRAVTAPEGSGHQQHGQRGQDRERRDALDGLRRDGRQRRQQRAPRPGSEVARRPVAGVGLSLARARQDHRQLPAPSTNSVGAIATCSQRPTGEPSRLAT